MKKIALLVLLNLFIPFYSCPAQVVQDTYKGEYKSFLKDNKNTKLSYSEYFALSEYKNNDYEFFNRYLRTGELCGKHTVARTKLILAGLKKLPGFKGKSYRGVSFEDFPDLFTYYTTVGNIVSDPGFMSTSTDRKVAITFLQDTGVDLLLLMTIYGKSGKIVRGIGAAGDDSEDEVLYPPGTKFKVIKTKTVRMTMPDYDLNNTKVTQVILKEVTKEKKAK